MPSRIAVAFVAEIRGYGFGSFQGRFAELLRILERKSGNGLANVAEFARRIWLHEGMTGRAVADLRDEFGYAEGRAALVAEFGRRIWLCG